MLRHGGRAFHCLKGYVAKQAITHHHIGTPIKEFMSLHKTYVVKICLRVEQLRRFTQHRWPLGDFSANIEQSYPHVSSTGHRRLRKRGAEHGKVRQLQRTGANISPKIK